MIRFVCHEFHLVIQLRFTDPMRFTISPLLFPINSPCVPLRFSYIPPCIPCVSLSMEPLHFTMGSQWIPSHSRAVIMYSFAFPVGFAPCAPRTLRDTEPLGFTMGYRWDPRFLSRTFSVPMCLSLDFLHTSHLRFARLLVYFDIVLCPLFIVRPLVEQQTRNNHKKHILHKEKTQRDKSIKCYLSCFSLM